MATANQKAYDQTLKHHVLLLRFGSGLAARVVELLNDAEGDLLEKIAAALARGTTTSRLEALLESVKERRTAVFETIASVLRGELEELAEAEATWEGAMARGVSPIELNLATVPLETLKALVDKPISGLTLEGWLNNISAAEVTALQRQINMGVVEGETIDQIVKRIRGSKAANFEDGVMAVTRRNAEALARTSVNFVSNQAREEVWNMNKDIIKALRWTSTLDGRTSNICKARDGKLTPVGKGKLDDGDPALLPATARPPAHFNCRSVMVSVLNGVAIAGDRPFVADDRTRADREADFRAEAKERGVSIKQVRAEWADSKIGRVPAETTYNDWLKRQSSSFQDDVLGPERAKLFRDGTPLDRFVDQSGKTISLDELRNS